MGTKTTPTMPLPVHSEAKTNVRLARNDSGVFEVRWREVANGIAQPKRKSLRTRCEQEAQQSLSSFLLSHTRKSGYTIGQAWELRQAETLAKTHDPQRIRDAWKALLPFFADVNITTLKQSDLNEYVQERLELGRALSTIRRELGELLTSLKAMVDARRVSSDHLAKLVLPTAHNTRPRFLTSAQKADVLARAVQRRTVPGKPSRIELFMHIGLETGQRKRAIERLTWDQVDFDARMVHFAKVGEPATKKRKPSVPMSQALETLLRAEWGARETPWVLRNEGSVRESFASLVDACGLQGITPHSLRHTFVSHLLMRGKPIYDVAQIVGMTVKMVETTYGHLTPEHLRRVLD